MGVKEIAMKHNTHGLEVSEDAVEPRGRVIRVLKSAVIHKEHYPLYKGYGQTVPESRAVDGAKKKRLEGLRKDILQCSVYFGVLLAGILAISLVCNWVSM